jgi:hypothetical protein
VLLFLLFTLPFSSENTLVGFQVQFYFIMWFALLHIWLTLRSDCFSWQWVLGQLSGILAVISMASGFLSSVAVLVLIAQRWVHHRRATAQELATAVVALALVVAGWALKADVPLHDFLKSHSVAQFATSLLQLAAWPDIALYPWAAVLVAPTLWFILSRIGARPLSPNDAVLLGLLVWVILQMAATAYARGASVLASRYFDLLAVNLALGFIVIAREASARWRAALPVLWFVAVCSGLLQQSWVHWRDALAASITAQQHRTANVRAYLQTNDAGHLLNKAYGDLPYPSGEVLLERLKSASIRRVMPPSVRRPVAVFADHSPEMTSALPDGLSPPPYTDVFSSDSIATRQKDAPWRSAIQPDSSSRLLRFRVAGDLSEKSQHLRLVVKSASGEAAVTPDAAAGLRWKTINVFRPPGEWWIEATDTNPGAWFAFTAPVELGRLRWFVDKLLKHHLFVQLAGGGMLALGIWLLLRPGWRDFSNQTRG